MTTNRKQAVEAIIRAAGHTVSRLADRVLKAADGEQCCVCACDYDSDGFVCWDCAAEAADKDLRQRLADTEADLENERGGHRNAVGHWNRAEALATARRDGLRELLGRADLYQSYGEATGWECLFCGESADTTADIVHDDCRYVALCELAGLEAD